MKRTSLILILIAILSFLSALLLNSSIIFDFFNPESTKPIIAGIVILIAGLSGALLYLLVQTVKQKTGNK